MKTKKQKMIAFLRSRKIEVWNRWREMTNYEWIDLQNANLQNADLRIARRCDNRIKTMKNQIEIVKEIADGMIGIGGIPSNEEFYAELNMRIRAALKIITK